MRNEVNYLRTVNLRGRRAVMRKIMLAHNCIIPGFLPVTPTVRAISVSFSFIFIARQRAYAERDTASAMLSVCPSVRHIPVLDQNECSQSFRRLIRA